LGINKYTYVQDGNHSIQIQHSCGLILWSMIREEIWPMTKVSTNDLKTQLSELNFAACNTSVPVLISKMMDTHELQLDLVRDYRFATLRPRRRVRTVPKYNEPNLIR
jgi:hypothetical protein